jgi:hypothetical protein
MLAAVIAAGHYAALQRVKEAAAESMFARSVISIVFMQQLFTSQPQSALNGLFGEVVGEPVPITFGALSPCYWYILRLGDSGRGGSCEQRHGTEQSPDVEPDSFAFRERPEVGTGSSGHIQEVKERRLGSIGRWFYR